MSATETAPSSEEAWRYLRETAEILRRLGEETDRRFEQTGRRFEETDRRFEQIGRRFEETDRQFRETDRKLKEVSKQLGDLGNRLGEFVEEQVMPSALRLMQEQGIEVHETHRRVHAKRHGRVAEIDLLLVDTTDVVAIEVKSTLNCDHIDRHIARLDSFKELFPHHAGMRVIGAVAGMVVPDEVSAYADERGLFVLVPAGEGMRLGNREGFLARGW